MFELMRRKISMQLICKNAEKTCQCIFKLPIRFISNSLKQDHNKFDTSFFENEKNRKTLDDEKANMSAERVFLALRFPIVEKSKSN